MQEIGILNEKCGEFRWRSELSEIFRGVKIPNLMKKYNDIIIKVVNYKMGKDSFKL